MSVRCFRPRWCRFVLALATVYLASCRTASPALSADSDRAPVRIFDCIKYSTGRMPVAAPRVVVDGVQVMPVVYDTRLDADRDGALSDEERSRLRAHLASLTTKGVWGWGEAYRWSADNPRVAKYCCLDQETFHPKLRSIQARTGSIERYERYYLEILDAAKTSGPPWAVYGVWGLPTFEMATRDEGRPEHDPARLARAMGAVMPCCYLPDWKKTGKPWVTFPVPLVERIRRDGGPDKPIIAFVTRHKGSGHPKGRPNAREARMSAADFRAYCDALFAAGADGLALWESYQWDRDAEDEAAYRAMLRESLEIMVEAGRAAR